MRRAGCKKMPIWAPTGGRPCIYRYGWPRRNWRPPRRYSYVSTVFVSCLAPAVVPPGRRRRRVCRRCFPPAAKRPVKNCSELKNRNGERTTSWWLSMSHPSVAVPAGGHHQARGGAGDPHRQCGWLALRCSSSGGCDGHHQRAPFRRSLVLIIDTLHPRAADSGRSLRGLLPPCFRARFAPPVSTAPDFGRTCPASCAGGTLPRSAFCSRLSPVASACDSGEKSL